MVAQFNILGRQVGSHYLAIATLGTTFLGSWLAMRGGSKSQDPSGKPTPPIQASTSDEESFIKDFLKAAEAEEKKAKH
ncbi:hypothetical protein BGX38DRAFT_1203375 [Terfezia claveryi]|nr:hypothetical protein BGX38DRAFT_1203375 [Terfezia claveryi]